MTETPQPAREPPTARETPAVIPLPPPADTPAPKRRSGSRKRQRADMAFIRLDAGERAELVRRAADAGLSVGAYCRERALGAPGPRHRRSPPSPDIELLARNYAALNQIGNNLNQIARALNEVALIGGDNERLSWIIADLAERARQIQADLGLTLFANRQALGYDC
jgi:hypothetical protein